MASTTSTLPGGERTDRINPVWRPLASTTGNPAYSGVIQRDALAAADVRRGLGLILATWSLEGLQEPAGLVATELVTNASEHARGEVIRVTVTRTARYRVRVQVTDRSQEQPKVLPLDPLAEHGRGLYLVACTAVRWGVRPYRWGKSVWAELEVAL
ncbi:ATP-binding protein [Streptomyces prasinus]|uniref:ATP-binding protein n=1 Tax=Streptomyces prasinus TaxID=67345 RepID=UPI0033E47385